MLRKKCSGASQQGGVKIVAQIGDHAETGMIHQIRTGVVANAFENGRGNQCKSHDAPGIREMRGHELLQVDRAVRSGNHEKLNVLRPRRGTQDSIQDWTHQQVFESVKATDRRHEQNRGQDLPPVRERVADEARQLPHGPPGRGRPQALAGRRMDTEYKALFYLSRAPKKRGFGAGAPVIETDFAGVRPVKHGYFGMSRCTIFTRYPARRRCLPTSSAIMTERCCPPVQPKAMVR